MSPQFNLYGILQQYRQNPMALLRSRYQIPEGLEDPSQIIQHLLNTGQVSQAQVNQAMQMRSDPRIQNLMK